MTILEFIEYIALNDTITLKILYAMLCHTDM